MFFFFFLLRTNSTTYSQQPWCSYALHLATFTSLAFVVDPLLLASCWWATADWDMDARRRAFWAQFIFMFGFTKVIKLVGLFRKNPSDIIFLPASIIFGYFHGLIKIHALCTLKMVRLLKPQKSIPNCQYVTVCGLHTHLDVVGKPCRWRQGRQRALDPTTEAIDEPYDAPWKSGSYQV